MRKCQLIYYLPIREHVKHLDPTTERSVCLPDEYVNESEREVFGIAGINFWSWRRDDLLIACSGKMFPII